MPPQRNDTGGEVTRLLDSHTHLSISPLLLLSLFIMLVTMLCLWAIDVSMIAMRMQSDLTNGFRIASANQIYHVALAGIAVCTLAGQAMWIAYTLRRLKQ